MAMAKRKRDRQPAMWTTATNLVTAASHPFYMYRETDGDYTGSIDRATRRVSPSGCATPRKFGSQHSQPSHTYSLTRPSSRESRKMAGNARQSAPDRLRAQIDCRVAVEEVVRPQPERLPHHRRDRQVFGARQVVHPEVDPHDHVLIANRAIARGPQAAARG